MGGSNNRGPRIMAAIFIALGKMCIIAGESMIEFGEHKEKNLGVEEEEKLQKNYITDDVEQ